MGLDSFDLSDFLPYRLAVLSERISRRLSLDYGRLHGISMPEWRVLVHLARCKEVSVREIHTYANLEKPRVSRAVTKLAASGLVRKSASKQDHRLVAISLTDKGRSVLQEILNDALALENRLLEALSEKERMAFDAIAEKLHGVLDDDPLARPRSEADNNDAQQA